MIRVKCDLTDCVNFNLPQSKAAAPGQCDCSHPEKKDYQGGTSCPLYKKNWMQSSGDITGDLKNRFKKRHLKK